MAVRAPAAGFSRALGTLGRAVARASALLGRHLHGGRRVLGRMEAASMRAWRRTGPTMCRGQWPTTSSRTIPTTAAVTTSPQATGSRMRLVARAPSRSPGAVETLTVRPVEGPVAATSAGCRDARRPLALAHAQALRESGGARPRRAPSLVLGPRPMGRRPMGRRPVRRCRSRLKSALAAAVTAAGRPHTAWMPTWRAEVPWADLRCRSRAAAPVTAALAVALAVAWAPLAVVGP